MNIENLTINNLSKVIDYLIKSVEELKKQKDPDKLVDRATAMKRLCVGSSTFWQYQKDGLLDNINPYGHPRFSNNQITDLINNRLKEVKKGKK